MKASENKIERFCSRNGLEFKLEQLRFNATRAKIETVSEEQHRETLKKARRLSGIHVDDWANNIAGIWTGYIYLQGEKENERYVTLCNAELKRSENWWNAYYCARKNGMSPTAAAQQAESLFPTPKEI